MKETSPDTDFPMTGGRVNYVSWLFRVLAWDTLLPALVILIPTAIEWLVPDSRGLIEIISVLLPSVAFFIRFRSGRRFIMSNACTTAAQRMQFVAFCIGIVPLALIECFLILVSPAKLLAVRADRVFFGVLLATYLTAMIVAMYPGRSGLTQARMEEMEAFPENRG